MPPQRFNYDEVVQLLAQVDGVNPPMPAEDASDAEWEAWADLQEVQATIHGYASQLRSQGYVERSHYLSDAVATASKPGFRALVGDRLASFQRLFTIVEDYSR